jgi:Uma2 family endonuclease
MLVSVPAYNSFYYPDVVVTCEPTRGSQQTVGAPCFIVEVLSPTTASIDKREKRIAYTSLESLQEYVLVYQSRMRVDVYQRGPDGWNLTILHQPEHRVPISCLDVAVSLEEIFRGVSFPLRVAEDFDEDDDEEWLRIVASSARGNQPSPASCPKLIPTVLNPPST